MTIQNMIATIWYFIRDYHANTYSLKFVVNAAKEHLEQEGHTATINGKGKLTVDGIPYLIYKEKGWNSYDVRNIGW